MVILSNTVAAKLAAQRFLSSHEIRVCVTAGRTADGFTLFNTHEDGGTENVDGLEALKHATRLTNSHDNCGYIFYLEDDRIKVCAVQRGHFARRTGMTSSFIRGPLGSISSGHYWFVIDLSDNYGAGFHQSGHPPSVLGRQSVIKKTETGSLSSHLGHNGVKAEDGEYHEGTIYDLTWAKKLLTDECIPIAVVGTYTDFNGTLSNAGALVAWLHNGARVERLPLPTICFTYGPQSALSTQRKFISTNFTPEEAEMVMAANSDWQTVWYNTYIHFTGRQSGGSGRLFIKTGAIMPINSGMLSDNHRTLSKYITVEHECSVFKLHGSKWENLGGPTDEYMLDVLLSDGLKVKTNSSRRPITFVNANNDILMMSVNLCIFVPRAVDPEASLLVNSIERFKERSWFLRFRESSIGEIMNMPNAQIFVKTDQGLLYSPTISHEVKDGVVETITLDASSNTHFFGVGTKGDSAFRKLDELIYLRGKKLMKELKVDGIRDYLFKQVTEKAEKLAEKKIKDIKDELDLRSSQNVGDLFGTDTSGRIWGGVGESFAFELFKSLGPPDWGCTVVDGHIIWYKDKLRWVNRNSGDDTMDTRQNREGAFVRYETPFNQLITLSRTSRGWCIMTRFWGVGLHPNISGCGLNNLNQSMCHGAVDKSILSEDKKGKNMIHDYNQRNGSFDLTEALRVVNYAAQLMEASVVAGDSGAGHVRVNFDSATGRSMLPLMKWNAFDTESMPEEDRVAIHRAYHNVGRSIVWAILPELELLIVNCLNSKWFWEPPKTVPKTKGTGEAPNLKKVAEDFRSRVPRPEEAGGLGALFG